MASVLDERPQNIIPSDNLILSKSFENKICPQVSFKIKGLILLGLLSKHRNKQTAASNKECKRAVNKWYTKAKAQQRKFQVFQRMFSLQSISELSFLYRLKAYCRKSKQNSSSQTGGQNQQDAQGDICQAKNKQNRNPEHNQNNLHQNMEQKQSKQSEYSIKINVKINQKQLKQEEQEEGFGSAIEHEKNYTKQLNKIHLKCISQQTQMALTSQKNYSRKQILQEFDDRLNAINNRLQKSAIRATKLLINRIILRYQKFALSKVKNV